MKRRVCFVVAGLGAGGAEQVIALVSAHWAEQGHEVSVVAFDSPDDAVYHQMHPAVRLVRLGPDTAMLRIAGRVRRLREWLQAERPDAVVSFLFKINVMTLIAARGLGISVAVCERNHPLLQQAHPIWAWLRRRTYPWAKRVVLQTEASRATMPATIGREAVVIRNPIRRFERSPEAAGGKILAAVGRLDRQKGFDMLLAAFARVAPDHPDWRLVIWGEGPERPSLEVQVQGLGLTGRVTMPGLSDGPQQWVQQAAAFVLSSRFEGMPNALGEALAAGLPVAAFDCEFGVSEMIEPEISGLLVRAGDVDALTKAVNRLLSDSLLRRRLGSAAMISARNANLQSILHEWDKLLMAL